MTRLLAFAAALLCAAAAPAADTQTTSGDAHSTVERHWLVYIEMRRQKDQPQQ